MVTSSSETDFLSGNSEMARRTRAFDWNGTPLGPPASWPSSLKAMVRMALTTRHPIFIWWGPDLTCLYNDAYRDSLGPDKHPRILGAPGREAWSEIWHIIGPQIELVMSGRGSTWNENHLVPILRHGRLQDVYWTYSYGPIDEVAAAHGVGGVLVICNETTTHVVAERKLEHREEQLRLATEAAEVGTWDVDLVTDTLFWQDRVKTMFGISPSVAVTMRDFYDGLHPEDRESTTASFAAAIDSARRLVYDVEYRTVGKEDGRVRWVAAKGRGLFDETDRCIRVIGTAIDITRRKLTEASLAESQANLQEANRRKDEFLATLAHELRNPLAPLRNSLTLMRRDLASPAAIQKMTAIMDRQVDQLVRLTDDLLDVSRISLGKLALRSDVVSLNLVIERAVEACSPAIHDARQRLDLALEEPSPVVNGDAARLTQVFGNLIGNASKFTADGGTISVNASRIGQTAVITVKDSGIGLARDKLEAVFGMFAQLDTSLERSKAGLGIGLALAKRLVEMHGGRIEARSEGLGRGSEFEIVLPLQEDAELDDPEEVLAALQTTKLMRILVVDDNLDSAETLSLVLESMSHQVRVASGGLEALEIARVFRPNTVFLDIGMPDMNGYEACRRLRQESGLVSMSIVALTGWGQAEAKGQAQQAGFDDHLTKPAGLDELQNVLAKAAQKLR